MAEIHAAVMALLKEDAFTKRLLDLITEAVAEAVNRVNEAAEARIAELEGELATAKTRLADAEQRLEDGEAYSRRNSLIISVIPETSGESTDQVVLDVGRAAGLELSPATLDRTHRLGRAQPGKVRPIIAKFVSFNSRQSLFTNRKELSTEKLKNHPILTRSVINKTYISECLTPKNQHLLYAARQLKKQKLLWAAYTTNGSVRVKKTAEAAATNIADLADLETIVEASALRQFSPRGTRARAGVPARRGADHPSWRTADAVNAWVTERRRVKTARDTLHHADSDETAS